MAFFTELHIGLANAWIGSLLVFLTLMRDFSTKDLGKRLTDISWHNSWDKKIAIFSLIAMYTMMIFTIWVPLKLGTIWFYVGSSLFVIGFICRAIASRNYASTPKNEAVQKGLYSISRNPLYVSFSLMFLGLVIASLSLPLLLIWIIYNICTHLVILSEERYCLETYKESYQKYKQKVPRYFLFF